MPDVTIIQPEETAVTETPAEANDEAATALANAATEIAEIEANRDVAIAEIHAETEQNAIEARADAIDEENNQWRQNIETQVAALQTTASETQSTLAQLTQAVELLTNPPPAIIEESDEVTPDNQEAPEPKAENQRKKKFRLI